MTALAIKQFGGMLPRYGDQKIPDGAASSAQNTLLLSGELRGINGQAIVNDMRDIAYEIRRVYRIPNGVGGFEWVPFGDSTIDFVKGPLINDAFDRYYWTSENGAPQYNTLSRFQNDQPSYRLGVPQPVQPLFSVTPDGTGQDLEVTRSYTYVFLTLYGEEGPPSDAVVASGKEDDVWELRDMQQASTLPNASEYAITHKRIYRTVTSSIGTVDYHFVADVDAEDTDYDDILDTNTVAAQQIMQSETWFPPPDNLIGLVAHPNGFLVGFTNGGRDLYFSEPYRPHAWPPDYVLSTQDIIQGLGVYQTSVAVCTQGFPYVASGIRPDGISFTKAQTPDPCLSTRRGIVPMPFGVYYPSDNGLMLISTAGFRNATQLLLTKQEWQRDYAPHLLDAVRWQSQYTAFYDSDDGFMFAPEEQLSAFVELAGSQWKHSVVQNDLLSGDVFMVQDNIVYEWNPAFGIPQLYKWVSKEQVSAKPVNFGACKFEFDKQFEITPEELERRQLFNDQRFQYPLNPLNFNVLSQVRKIETLPSYPATPGEGMLPLPENTQPFHKSPLYDTTAEAGDTFDGILSFTLWADDEEIITIDITDEGLYRLPAGYKSKKYRFEFNGNVNLKSFKIAETGKELGTI